MTEEGLSVSSPGFSSCAIDSSAISHEPLQGGKKARVNATIPRRRKKKLRPSKPSPCRASSRYFFSFFPTLPPPVRPPVASPLQYLRACKPTSDFHLSRFASSTIRDISARALCFALECRCDAMRCNGSRLATTEQPGRKLHCVSTCYKLINVFPQNAHTCVI